MGSLIELARKLRPYIESAAQTLADTEALDAVMLYPEWRAGMPYIHGYKLRRNGKLYRVLQGHSAMVGWEPENTPALYAEINESHAGTATDPIPYSGNMALEEGKYYAQDGVVYRCIWSTGNPVYHQLAELVGLYVEKVEEI